MEVRAIDTREGFAELEDEWNALLACSTSNTVFLTWEWLYLWWDKYKDSFKQLFIVTVRSDHELVGIAPLYIRKKSTIVTWTTIQFLGSNIVCSDYLDFITSNSQKDEIVTKILSYIRSQTYWDVLRISDIPSDSDTFPIIENFFSGYRSWINDRYTACPFIDLNAGFDAVYDSYDSPLKNMIKRKSRKFFNLNGANYVEDSCKEDLEKAYTDFLNVSELRFKEKKIASPFSQDSFRSFHHSVLKTFHKKGMARLSFLKIEEKAIAGMYLLIYNNRHYFYQSGFLPSTGRLSPGTLLMHYSIKAASDSNAQEFDFLRGNEQYKRQWAKLIRYNGLVVIYNNTFRGRVAHITSSFISFIHRMKTVVKAIISALNNLFRMSAGSIEIKMKML